MAKMRYCFPCGYFATAGALSCVRCGGALADLNQVSEAKSFKEHKMTSVSPPVTYTLTRFELTKGEGKTYWLTAPEGTELYQTSLDIIDGKLHVWAKVPDKSSGTLTVEFLRAYTGDPLPDKSGITFFGKIPGNHITEVLLMIDWNTRGPNNQEEKQTAASAPQGSGFYNLGASLTGAIP